MITSAQEFIRLRCSELKEEYDRAAHEEAPVDVWWELVHHFPEMKTWVIANKTVPIQILEALSLDQDALVRQAVAMKRKASPEIFERLARDPDSGVRYAVACNDKAPVEVLQILLNDEWDVIANKARARLREAQ